MTDRLTGFELRTDLPGRGAGTAQSRDRRRFADAYREIEGSAQNAPSSDDALTADSRHRFGTSGRMGDGTAEVMVSFLRDR
jgi:hypothetical protein